MGIVDLLYSDKRVVNRLTRVTGISPLDPKTVGNKGRRDEEVKGGCTLNFGDGAMKSARTRK